MTAPRIRSLRDLAGLTAARVALGAHGSGMPTAEALRFKLDHARAREAVWTAMDTPALLAALAARNLPHVEVRSEATDRSEYLRRPDLGRRLAPGAEAALRSPRPVVDLAIVIADGLSATAIAVNAVPMAAALVAGATAAGWSVAPIVVAHQARVALGDPVGTHLAARCVAMLIGERPGLSAADSLGCYLTYAPEPGLPDSRRNCLSNIRAGGLPIEAAASQALALISLMFAQSISGVALRANDIPSIENRPA